MRRKLMGQMVGGLYPGILSGEITKLSDILGRYPSVTDILKRCRR